MGAGLSISGILGIPRRFPEFFLGAWFLLGGFTALRADSPAPSFIVDLDNSAPASFPDWLKGVPPDSSTTSTTENDFAVTRPPGAEGDLLLTVIFDEKDGGFLRVYRKNQDQAQAISDNLYEGTGAPNQRTLLIPGIDAQFPTTIVLQSSSGISSVRRLVWEWPQTRQVPMVRASTESVVIRRDAILTGEELSGQPLPSPQPGVQIDYTSTPLLDQPAKIDGSVVFKVALDHLPAHVRLEGKVAGLPLAQQLECWINGQHAGVFGLSLPPLRDPAYLLTPGTAPALAAWRPGSLYLPATLWNSGENQVEFRPVAPENAQTAPSVPIPVVSYAIKDVVLELIYDDASTTIPASPQTSTPDPATPPAPSPSS